MFKEFNVKHIETGKIYTVHNISFLKGNDDSKPEEMNFLVYMYDEWAFIPACWFVPIAHEEESAQSDG